MNSSPVSFRWLNCGCVLACIAALGCDSNTDASSAQASRVDALVERVIHAQDEGEAQQTLGELSAMGQVSAEGLRRIFNEAKQPEVRIQAAKAVADACVLEAVPDLIDSLDDGDPRLREAFDKSLRKMLVISVRYDPHGTPEERRAAMDRYRDYWNRRNTPEFNAIGNDREKAKKAMEEQIIFQ